MDKYDVICRDNLGKLISDANDMISKGWIPVGGISIEPQTARASEYYYQAMIRII